MAVLMSCIKVDHGMPAGTELPTHNEISKLASGEKPDGTSLPALQKEEPQQDHMLLDVAFKVDFSMPSIAELLAHNEINKFVSRSGLGGITLMPC